MTFTQEEEEILKLMVQELKAKRKLAKEKQVMNVQIRNETTVLSNQIVKDNEVRLAPFYADVAVVEASLKKKVE